jgi:hypothetical protein
MRRLLAGLAWALICCLFTRVEGQGSELVVMSVRSSTLSGKVGLVTDEGAANVSVVLFDCGSGPFRGHLDPIELERAQTDAQGRFKFGWRQRSRVCLKFQTGL